MLDGSGPFRMLLDTGATHSAIAADVAAAKRRAGAVATSKVISAGRAKRSRPIVVD